MRNWTVLGALAVSTFLYVTTETLPIGLLPQIAADLGTSTGAIGLLVTAYGLMVVIATIPLTRATHRFSRRRLLGALLMISTVATAVSALAPNYGTLLAGRVVIALSQALFWAVITPAGAALVAPQHRGKAISILYAGSSIGPLLGVPGGTWLGQQTTWRVPFLVLAGLGLVVSLVITALMPDTPPGAAETDRGTDPDRRRYRLLVVTVAVLVTGAFTAFTCINPFLTEVTGVGEGAIGPILLVRGIAGLAGVFAVGFIATGRLWPATAVLVAGQAVALGVLFVGGGSPVVAVLAFSVAGFALSGMTAVLGRRILVVAPGDTDMASAGTSTAFNVGITAGAFLGSRLLDGGDLRASALVAAVISGLALVSVFSERKGSSDRVDAAYSMPTR
ncbi:MFS transporter [Actinoplanes sp. CA-030573]|uniref:MFS transporter n=1 Tax=Actinoplanes sp. CA-030573 TaxID=3239898 RepID=UPI003D8C34AE